VSAECDRAANPRTRFDLSSAVWNGEDRGILHWNSSTNSS
jgi:hypothetical protein